LISRRLEIQCFVWILFYFTFIHYSLSLKFWFVVLLLSSYLFIPFIIIIYLPFYSFLLIESLMFIKDWIISKLPTLKGLIRIRSSFWGLLWLFYSFGLLFIVGDALILCISSLILDIFFILLFIGVLWNSINGGKNVNKE